MNTHRAVIESSVPPMLTLVGSGPKDFCEKQLAWWVDRRPLGEFEEGKVLAVEPNVIGYVVVDRDGKAVRNFMQDKREAEGFAAEYNKDCKDAGIDWDYRVAVLTELEGN